jgi:hypothetical protein
MNFTLLQLPAPFPDLSFIHPGFRFRRGIQDRLQGEDSRLIQLPLCQSVAIICAGYRAHNVFYGDLTRQIGAYTVTTRCVT